MIDKNPWMGLNPYQEGQKLYGRDDETEHFIKMLLSEHVVVLCGQSGVGKTSFINACVCPAVKEKGILPILIRLRHNDYNNSYISQIKRSIHETLEKLPKEVLIYELYPLKEGEIESVLSFFKRHRIEKSNGEVIKPVIIFDQFEELFKLCQYPSIFLNEIDEAVSYDFRDKIGAKIKPFSLIISIREDYVSSIDRGFKSKEFRINRFYLEDLNEEQAFKVITMDGKACIDKETAMQILGSITGRDDISIDGHSDIYVSPILLSLYMNRLYDKCLTVNQSTITKDIVNLYNVVDIFSELYDEATDKISHWAMEYLEDMLLTLDNRRNNISEADVVREGHVKNEELEILVRYNIIRRFSYLGDIRIELSSDVFCPIVERRISKRGYQRHILLGQQDSVTKMSFAKRFVESFFHFKNNDEERDPLVEYVPKKVDYEIFISYRREDGRDHARNIQQALKAHGYKRIFFDYDSIQKGEFNKCIIDAIYSCSDFILVLSPKSMKRCVNSGDPVANEIRTALKYKKNIIPVTIDGKEVEFPRKFPQDLSEIITIQRHDHRSDSYFEHSIDELCEKLACKKSDDIF